MIVLWKFKEIPEDRGDYMPNAAFRWTFQIGWAWAGFVWQCRSRKTEKWRNSTAGYYVVRLWRRLWFGVRHDYYDGPHCMLSLGWLRFEWTGDLRDQWCTKCMPDSDEAQP